MEVTKNIRFRMQDLGLIPYQEAYRIQIQQVEKVINGGEGIFLICEHPSILTMGRLASRTHILASRKELSFRGIDIIETNRGGEVTLHAPGQLVVYPVINLIDFKKDIRYYLRKLEQVGIDLLSRFDIVANRVPGRTGVWVGQKKILSIGVGVKKWVTFHGLALNVNTDLDLFSLIRPCGLDVEMTSIFQIKKENVAMEEIKKAMKSSLAECFSCKIL